jgi:SNF2 family DNA or RNA helicase
VYRPHPHAHPPPQYCPTTQEFLASKIKQAVANESAGVQAGAAGEGKPDLEGVEKKAIGRLPQPAAITGSMHDYQLEGAYWLLGLYANGLSGILGDEMGLGTCLRGGGGAQV